MTRNGAVRQGSLPSVNPVPRSTSDLTSKGRATRARLLDAARQELAAHGVLEVATVASRARVAPSVVYNYFGSKDGLVEVVVHEFYDQYDSEVFNAPLAPDLGWVDREALRIEREVAFLYQHPLGRSVAAGLLHEAAATRADAERQRQHAVLAARNIRSGQRGGELLAEVDAGLAGAAIIGALRAMLAEALRRTPAPPQHLVADAARQLSAALLCPYYPQDLCERGTRDRHEVEHNG